jgi:hypothetical protein
MNYGLTHEQFMALLESQQNKCRICAKEIYESKKPMAVVDHCHRTNNVRGLLCQKCNTAIGLLGDDPTLLTLALRYLYDS